MGSGVSDAVDDFDVCAHRGPFVQRFPLVVAVEEHESVFALIGVLAKNSECGASALVILNVMAVQFCSYELVCVVHGERDGFIVGVEHNSVKDSRLDLGVFRCLVCVRSDAEEFDQLVAIENDVGVHGHCVVYIVTAPV